jgi:predicted kinase
VTRPALIMLRGNSASGKSSVAEGIRASYGRGVAIVGQDLLRRQVLRELPVPGGANVGLIDLVARYALSHGFHTIVEGILECAVYGAMLTTLADDHEASGGRVAAYYLDVPLEETLRRHAGRPLAAEVTEDQLRRWHLLADTVPDLDEVMVPATASLPDAVQAILCDTRLLESPLRTLHATSDSDPHACRWR